MDRGDDGDAVEGLGGVRPESLTGIDIEGHYGLVVGGVGGAVVAEENDVRVGADTRRSVVSLGEEGAVVLKFKSDEITKCWQRLIDAGASWDYPSYQPHVTLTYKVQGVDLDKIKPYSGELIFGSEVFRKITPVGEIDERNFRYKYNEDEPRDEDGKWTDGGGSSGDSSGDGGDSGGGDAKVSSASELFARHYDPSITADDVVAKTEGCC